MALLRANPRRQLDARAFRQAGYFTAAQAKEFGYSYQAQKYHVDAGNWVRVDRGLFRLADWPPGPDDEWVRWSLWSGGRGIVSHESALSVHDLSDANPAKIHLAVPAGFHAKDDLVVTHKAPLGPEDIESRQGWQVTTPLRTILDVAGGEISQEHVDAAVSEAVERGLTSRRELLRSGERGGDRAALRIERALARMEETI